MFAWIADKIRWLLLAAVAGGPVMVYMGWSDASRIRDIETNGIETTALIEGATRTTRRRGGETYALKLAWRDKAGGIQKAEKVTVSSTFAKQIISGDKITRQSVRIKYLPDATIDSTPIVLEDAARQEDQDDFLVKLGLGTGAVGIVGSALFFLVGRRRRSAEAVPPSA